jgi:hypothetical protein
MRERCPVCGVECGRVFLDLRWHLVGHAPHTPCTRCGRRGLWRLDWDSVLWGGDLFYCLCGFYQREPFLIQHLL